MPSKVPAEKSQDRLTNDGKERRKKAGRMRRRSSARHATDAEEDALPERTADARESTPAKRMTSMPIPELNRRADSPNTSHISLPYPSFSKAHSRESVVSRENLATPPPKNGSTPDQTDLQEEENGKTSFDKRKSQQPGSNVDAPPTPPLTADESVTEARESPSKTRRAAADRKDEIHKSSILKSRRGSPLSTTKLETATTSRKSSARTVHASESISSLPSKDTNQNDTFTNTVQGLSSATSSIANSDSTAHDPKAGLKGQNNVMPAVNSSEVSAAHGSDLSVRTPTPRGTPAPNGIRPHFGSTYPQSQPSGAYKSPVPPPPPPPPIAFSLPPPRVDYLMQHGGLSNSIQKRLIAAPNPDTNSSWVAGELPNPTDMNLRAQAFFAPFRDLLDNYSKVIDKSGSIAVATGYRSIARRLLDRLEAVFARDISSEICGCLMCDSPDNMTLDDERGVSWGEILEYVSGRKELPQWPPFVLAHNTIGLGLTHDGLQSPCQILDVDVPNEYREHYIRQSKKTKESVDEWLTNQNTEMATPPTDADDDTLTFAILTHLDPQLRPILGELLGVTSLRPQSIKPNPESRTQTPLNVQNIVEKSRLAIQRLYRLSSNPRAPEVAVFLVQNRQLHNVLATLAAISDAEWDILTSGRFDGFLRSGAEDGPISQMVNARGARGPTPLSTHTPSVASVGAPVAMDEETEIAILAEVEREIFLGMEALENAFENLHTAAESVRRRIRERGAGLSIAAQNRRGGSSSNNILEARMDTPASLYGGEHDGDDWMNDVMSELAPDDSASVISKNRIRRKRRDERRTPAPIDETSNMQDPERHGVAKIGSLSRNSFRRRY